MLKIDRRLGVHDVSQRVGPPCAEPLLNLVADNVEAARLRHAVSANEARRAGKSVLFLPCRFSVVLGGQPFENSQACWLVGWRVTQGHFP